MKLTPSQIAALALHAGFTGRDVTVVTAIALAESEGNTEETHVNTDGSTDYGLLQINSVHPDLLARGDWRNPLDNMRMGRTLYEARGGKFTDWAAYNSGAYLVHMAVTAAAANRPDDSISVAPNAPKATVEQTGLSNPLSGLTGFFRFITSAHNWIRVGQFVIGFALIVMGFLIATRKDIATAGKLLGAVAA